MKAVVLVVVALAGAAHAADVVVEASECRHVAFDGTTLNVWDCNQIGVGAPVPTPRPPAPPGPTAPPPPPPPAGACPSGSINDDIGGGNRGFVNETMAIGEHRAYCATLPVAAKQLRFEITEKCQQAIVAMRITPPAGAHYSDGATIAAVDHQYWTATFGGPRKVAGYVPPGTWIVELFSEQPNGTGCPGVNQFDLIWKWSE